MKPTSVENDGMMGRRGITRAQSIVLVAIVAVSISILLGIVAALDDTYFPARKRITKTWNVGPSPKVEVDLFEGYINVVQSTDGQVSAVLTPFAVTKVSQAATDAALGDIAISAIQEGDTIRIKTTKAPRVVMSQLKADIELRVPPDANLDLVTGHGYIYIGKSWGGPHGACLMSSPVALRSVKARDLGNMYIGIEAEILSNPSRPATKLDLGSRHGSVTIKGDNVLISAKADGGAIKHVGQPAPGSHSFVNKRYTRHRNGNRTLPKGIKLVLPAKCSFEVDAESISGKVSSDFPTDSTSQPTPNSLKGAVGADRKIKLEIRSDDGSIEIRRNPGAEDLLDPDEREASKKTV